MKERELFGDLRALLARPPDPQIFLEICRLIPHGQISDPLFEYLRSQLERWPEDLGRPAPWNWVAGLLMGSGPRELELCNALELVDLRLEASLLAPALSCGHLTRILYVNLSGNRIGLGGLRALETSGVLPSLRHLILSKHQLGDEGIEVLVSGSLLSRLRTLVWSRGQLSVEGVEALCEVEDLALETLDVSGNVLGDEAVEALVASTLWEQLIRLGLRGVALSEEGARALARAAPRARLRHLDLRGNSIGAAGRQALADAGGVFAKAL